MGSISLSTAIRRAVLFRPSATGHFQLIRNATRVANPLLDADAGPKEETRRKITEVTETESLERNTGSSDPFGIEDVVANNASVIVQGFYGNVYPNKDKKSTQEKDEVKVQEVDLKASKLKQYEGWIKHREVTREANRIDGPSENCRIATFGNVRLDSDNIVEQHGQYDRENRVAPSRSSQQWKSPPLGEENASTRSKNTMTASEFLKQFKEVKADEKAKASRAPTVEKSVNPRAVKQEVQEELDQISNDNISQEYLDSNVIPKIYQLPEYNQITKQDMWSILKKSVIFNNDFILAINKPPGIPIHSPSVDCRHFITEFLDRFSDFGQCKKIYPIHRLDKETTGVLLFAKDPKVASVIIEKFANRQVDKKYLVITKLCPQLMEGTIKIPIGEGRVGGTEKFRSVLKPDLRKYEIKSRRGECRDAVTHFKVLRSMQDAAFLEVRPETGIKHQIRLHLGLGIGCPIIGDHKYSHRDRMAPQRLHPALLHRLKVKQSKVRELPLHLHCNSISFTLPEEFVKSSEPVYVHAKVPRYFSNTLKAFGL